MIPKKRIIPVFVPHLGCPNDCVFCNQRRISGKTSPATAENVRSAIEYARDNILNGEKGELAFYGGSFTAIPASEQEELLGAAFPFYEAGVIDSIRLSTRPDCINEEVLERLRRYKVRTVELGVQSMCEPVLRAANRGHSARDAEAAAKMVKDAGFSLILQMMTGLPEDTPERSMYTARKIAKLAPDGVRIYPTVIIKDTRLFDMWKRGEYKEHTVEDAVKLCAGLMDIFDESGIPVIRLGLNPTEELSGGAAAGGAYHPAFGELVYGERYYNRERELLRDYVGYKKVVLGVARGQISPAVGQKRRNIIRLCEEFSIKKIKITETDLKKWEVSLLEVEK